jgi:DNA-binding transcriptional ArsR family regulator
VTSEETQRVLTDPKAMRAMAHPVRMALLDLLKLHGTLTATAASEALGESPANCAFHLRTLAKYGFVEEAGGGKGRERPWRSKRQHITIESHDLEDPRAKIAADALSQALEDRWLRRARRGMASSDALPEEWRGKAHSSRTLSFLTADELREVSGQVLAVIDSFRAKHSAEDRPAGSLPVELLFFGFPIVDFAELEDGPDQP